MCVNMPRMKDVLNINKVSKEWWHLWDSSPCCMLSFFKKSPDSISDKSQETRSKLLLSAFNEIYERGFQAASLSNILKDTGLTKGGLYHHFSNKLELGYSVVDEVIYETMYANWIEPLKDTDDPVSVLKDIIIKTGRSMTEESVLLGCPLNNLAQEMSPIDKGFRDRISGIYQVWQNEMEAAIDRGKLAGNVDTSIDSKDMALLFLATLQGCTGLAKSIQKLDVMMSCGQGLLDRLDTIRPPQNIKKGTNNVQ